METKNRIGFTAGETTTRASSSNPFRKFNWKRAITKASNILKLFAKLVVGAAIWMALFHFVPELEEYIPSLKTFCGWILSIAEVLFSLTVNFLQKFM